MDKPKINYVSFYRSEGKYNLANHNDVSAQYVFTFPNLNGEQIKDLNLQQSYLIDIEKDSDYQPNSTTALELAYELSEIINNYWINPDKKPINRLVEYLESIEEEQEFLRHDYKIKYAEYKVDYWQRELIRLSHNAL